MTENEIVRKPTEQNEGTKAAIYGGCAVDKDGKCLNRDRNKEPAVEVNGNLGDCVEISTQTTNITRDDDGTKTRKPVKADRGR